MNIDELKREFEKRFYKNKNVIETAAIPFTVTLYQDAVRSKAIMLGLSPELAAAGAAVMQGRVCLADRSSDMLYTFIPNAGAGKSEIFSALETLYASFDNLSGADILTARSSEVLFNRPEYYIAAVVTLLLSLADINADGSEIARICHTLMPEVPLYKLISALCARKGYAVLIDTYTCEYEYLPFPCEHFKIILFKAHTAKPPSAYPPINSDIELMPELTAALGECDVEKFAHTLTQGYYTRQAPPAPILAEFLADTALKCGSVFGATLYEDFAVCFARDDGCDEVISRVTAAYEDKFARHPGVFICG